MVGEAGARDDDEEEKEEGSLRVSMTDLRQLAAIVRSEDFQRMVESVRSQTDPALADTAYSALAERIGADDLRRICSSFSAPISRRSERHSLAMVHAT